MSVRVGVGNGVVVGGRADVVRGIVSEYEPVGAVLETEGVGADLDGVSVKVSDTDLEKDGDFLLRVSEKVAECAAEKEKDMDRFADTEKDKLLESV